VPKVAGWNLSDGNQLAFRSDLLLTVTDSSTCVLIVVRKVSVLASLGWSMEYILS
jgi:hypothetical protein